MRPMPRKGLLLPVLALAVVACTSGGGDERVVGASTTDAAEQTDAAPAETRFTADAPSAEIDGAPSTVPEAAIAALDPDEIVAAQEQLLSDLFERVLPSTVRLRITQSVARAQTDFPFDLVPDGEPFPRDGDGSGFVWDREGHIVTNYHVIADAGRIRVIFPDTTEAEARVLGSDPDSDLAVLHVDLPADFLQPVDLGDSDRLKVGQSAIAIGTPFGREFTMTLGVISALGRRIESPRQSYSIPDAIQTDASVNPGNSGGPLLDRKGRVIGINSQIITRTGVNAGIGFAIPVNEAKRVIPALIDEGVYERAWLGVTVDTVDGDFADVLNLSPSTRGAIITSLIPDAPADQAGLRGGDADLTRQGRTYRIGGDVITALGGTPVRSIDDLIGYLSANTRPGDVVVADVIRDGEPIQIEVELGTRPTR